MKTKKAVTLQDLADSQRVLIAAVAGVSKDVKDLRGYTEAGFEAMNGRFDRAEDHSDRLEGRLDDFENSLDRIENQLGGAAYQH